MPTIKAPYNFVPLSEKVFFPSWADQISQDIPFSDGEDGVIELSIKNLSPLFVRDGHVKEEPTEWSSHIRVDGQKKYFIPATTLKGCFRSVLEILSFSKMSRYNDDSFGYRYFTTQVNSQYATNMKNVRYCGWLYLKDSKYYIDECQNGISMIPHSSLEKFYPDFNKGRDHETAEIKQMSIGTYNDPYPQIQVVKSFKQNTPDGKVYYTTYKKGDKENLVESKRLFAKAGLYQIVCTGYMENKKVEYLFSIETYEPKEISEDVIKKFNTIHKYTPYYAGEKGKVGFLKQRLSSGEKIPVFFEKAGEIISNIGITRMFRYPYNYSVKNEVEKAQERSSDSRKDLSEAIFGYTNSEDQLRGRVQFSHAFCTSMIQDGECVTRKGVFGQPRASYFPLYLNQYRGSISTYDSNIPVSGRKRYRIVMGNDTIKLSEGNGNEKTLTAFRPLPANKTFLGNIKIHNLRKAEIGALISAITFHGNSTQKVYHNLGLAKSYGYGCINCQITSLKGLKYPIEEYLKAFEEEIVSYIRQEYKDEAFSMQNDESIQMLVKIAEATHQKEGMQHMQLGEFEQFKESRNYSQLTEPSQIELLEMDDVKANLNRQRAEILYDEFKKTVIPKDVKDPEIIKEQIVRLEFVKEQYDLCGAPSAEIDLDLSQLKVRLNVLESPTQLSVGETISAQCIANKKVRIEGYDYDIQLTVPKGYDADSIVSKNVEVRIKQISKIGKIVQVEFLKVI